MNLVRGRLKNSPEFIRKHAEFMRALERVRISAEDGQGMGRFAASQAFVSAHSLVHLLIHDKQVPKSQVALFEKTVREFQRRRVPKDVLGWFVRHGKMVAMLADSINWPDKGTSKEQSQDIVMSIDDHGIDTSLVLHNQSGKDITANVKMLEAAVTLMLGSGVPRVDEIIYGDVYLVGDIERRKSIMAKYYVERDTIFVLVVQRFADSFMQSLIHEFGHRYYQKIMASGRKSEWNTHHNALGRSATRMTAPKIGTMIPTRSGEEAVVSVAPFGRSGKMAITLAGGGMIWLDDYLRVEGGNARKRVYPSLYAAKNDEEHFCEAFAFYCTGELADPHRAAFERILGIEKRVPIPAPAPAPPPAPPPPRIEGPRGQLAMFNPSRLRRRITGI